LALAAPLAGVWSVEDGGTQQAHESRPAQGRASGVRCMPWLDGSWSGATGAGRPRPEGRGMTRARRRVAAGHGRSMDRAGGGTARTWEVIAAAQSTAALRRHLPRPSPRHARQERAGSGRRGGRHGPGAAGSGRPRAFHGLGWRAHGPTVGSACRRASVADQAPPPGPDRTPRRRGSRGQRACGAGAILEARLVVGLSRPTVRH